jgi:ABC-type nitrate/sulfonate/bicarbonate transport system substrate-binding protein
MMHVVHRRAWGSPRRRQNIVGAVAVIAAMVLAGCSTSSASDAEQSAGSSASSSSESAAETSAAAADSDTSSAEPSAEPSAESSDASAPAGELPAINIVSFQAPSLGAFLPAVIAANGLDKKHGVDMKITYATTDNYNTEFAAGHYDVGVSAALLSEALRTERGVGVTYLFNLFDFWGTVVTSNPEVKSLADLQGKTLAAASATTNYAMFQWFAKQENVDISKIKVENQSTPGLSTMALTGRTDAVELWEPAYSTLVAKKPDIQTINLDMAKWQAKFGTGDIPYLGVAAQLDWAQAHPDLVQKMYDTYKEAAEWTAANPEDAGKIIAATIPHGVPDVITDLIKNNDRLQMNVVPASQVEDGIKAVFEAGLDSGYLKKQPPDSVVYEGLK